MTVRWKERLATTPFILLTVRELREMGDKRATRMEKVKHVTIYTDGACLGNPGPGGYGAILLYQGHRKELSAGAAPRHSIYSKAPARQPLYPAFIIGN